MKVHVVVTLLFKCFNTSAASKTTSLHLWNNQKSHKTQTTSIRLGGATSLLAQANAAEAFWKLEQQEAADAEAEWRSLRLEADGVSKVERLQDAIDKAEGELEAACNDILKFF